MRHLNVIKYEHSFRDSAEIVFVCKTDNDSRGRRRHTPVDCGGIKPSVRLGTLGDIWTRADDDDHLLLRMETLTPSRGKGSG